MFGRTVGFETDASQRSTFFGHLGTAHSLSLSDKDVTSE